MAGTPFTVLGKARPANPKTGGHYVPVAGGYQLIHATGPKQWAPGPPKGQKWSAPKVAASAPVTGGSIVTSNVKPPDPDTGGHYTPLGGNRWQLVHAVGKNQWKPGPPPLYSQPLYQPTQVLRGQALANAAKQMTNLQYDPAIKALSMQIAQNAQQGGAAQRQTSGYFNQLLPYAQQAATNVQGVGTGLNTQLQQIGQQTQQALAQSGQPSAALQDLAARGLGGGGTEALAQQLAQQQQAAAQSSQAAQNYGAQLGAANSALAQQNVGTYALRGQERLGEIAQATRLAAQPIEEKLAGQQVAKAAAYTANLGSLRQQEFNNLVAMQGLGLKQADITAQNQRTAATINAANQRTAATIAGANTRQARQLAQAKMLSDRTYQLNLKKYGQSVAKDQYQRTHGLGPYKPAGAGRGGGGGGGGGAGGVKPLGTASANALANRINQIVYALNATKNKFHKGQQQGNTFSYHDIASGRIHTPAYGGNAKLLNAAYNVWTGRGLSAGDIAALQAMGLSNPRAYFAYGTPQTTRQQITGAVQGAANRLIPRF
jgi:hypothetical protein